MNSPRIYTRCPACRNDTLTINDDKHLLCTWYRCPDPTAIDRVELLYQEIKDVAFDIENQTLANPCIIIDRIKKSAGLKE